MIVSNSTADSEAGKERRAEKLNCLRARKAKTAEKRERNVINKQYEWHVWANRRRSKAKLSPYVHMTAPSEERGVPPSFSKEDLDNSATNWKGPSNPALLSPELYAKDRKLGDVPSTGNPHN